MLKYNIDPACIKALPRGCGVYIFKGEGTLPLYVGKSVDIRSRVMSHLRAVDEANMVAQTRWIDYIETSGEIGALLLESRLIKDLSPLYNQRLRRTRTLSSIRLVPTERGLVPEVIDSQSVSLGSTPNLYGLFSSKHAANAKLKEIAQQHRLCMSALGLEKSLARGCFGYQLKNCLGVCVGKEDRQTHDNRLFTALLDSQVEIWPFDGPVDLIEVSNGWIQKHRVHNWCYRGTWCSKTGQTSYLSATQQLKFDLDSYKILVKPIMLKTVQIAHV